LNGLGADEHHIDATDVVAVLGIGRRTGFQEANLTDELRIAVP
jgi:hypothetical protein